MIIKLSSSCDIISAVSVPFNCSSPLCLKLVNCKFTIDQSAMTCFSLLSMSFSFVALIQISYNGVEFILINADHIDATDHWIEN